MKYKDNMPQLGRLALLLTNIPASADFIERFFSICGIIKDKKRQYEFWFIRSTLSFKIESWFLRKFKKIIKSTVNLSKLSEIDLVYVRII